MTTWTASVVDTHHKDKHKLWFRKACLSKEFERHEEKETKASMSQCPQIQYSDPHICIPGKMIQQKCPK